MEAIYTRDKKKQEKMVAMGNSFSCSIDERNLSPARKLANRSQLNGHPAIGLTTGSAVIGSNRLIHAIATHVKAA